MFANRPEAEAAAEAAPEAAVRTLWRRTQVGWTALMSACHNGHADCARLLLNAGADKNAKNKGSVSYGGGVRDIVSGFGDGLGVWRRAIFICVFRFCFRHYYVVVFVL